MVSHTKIWGVVMLLLGLLSYISCQTSEPEPAQMESEEDLDLVSITYEFGSGSIQGTVSQQEAFTLYKFEGIPFAEPPVQEFRFKPPVPKPLDEDTITQAISQKAMCAQVIFDKLIGGEDCLYLNVYTSSIPRTKTNEQVLKPVLVVFPEKDGIFSTEERTPIDEVMTYTKEGIVVVTFDARVGFLGYLTLQNKEISGNMGLKDHIVLLEWVQTYIHLFGGDPGLVTLASNPKAGASSHIHMLTNPTSFSELSFFQNPHESLFHAVIAQSGTILQFHGHMKNQVAENAGQELVEALKCGTGYTEEQKVICLQALPLDEIARQVQSNETKVQFLPVTDFYAGQPVLPYLPLQALLQGQVTDIPIIIGQDVMPQMGGDYEYFNENFEQLVNTFLNLNESSQNGSVTLTEKIKDFYVNISDFDAELADSINDLMADLSLGSALYHTAQLHARSGTSPVYLYQTFRSFPDSNILETFTTYLINFIKYHDPTPYRNSVPFWNSMKAGGPDETEFMEFLIDSASTEMKKGFRSDRMAFWQENYWGPETEEQIRIKQQFDVFMLIFGVVKPEEN